LRRDGLRSRAHGGQEQTKRKKAGMLFHGEIPPLLRASE